MITLLDDAKTQHRVRLQGIDAPEKGQAFGERSKQSLSDLSFHRDVTAQCHKRDRYGREVYQIKLRSTDVSLEQIRRQRLFCEKRVPVRVTARRTPSRLPWDQLVASWAMIVGENDRAPVCLCPHCLPDHLP
jgi:hypothetical protein